MSIQRLRFAVFALTAAVALTAAPQLHAQRGSQGRPGGGSSGGSARPSAPASRPSAPASRPSAPASRPSAPSARPSAPSAAPSRSAPSSYPSRGSSTGPSRSSAPTVPSTSSARSAGSSAPSRATSYSAPTRSAPSSANPSPTRSAVPSRSVDAPRSGADAGYPPIERSPSRVRFPAPASAADSTRMGSARTTSSVSGPSASRLRAASPAVASARGAAPRRERVASEDARTAQDGRALAAADREAILDRYRRAAPESTRAEGPSSRLRDSSQGRSTPSSNGLSQRAALAREKNQQTRLANARTSLSKVSGAERGEAATRRLRDLAAVDPAAAERYQRAGTTVARLSGAGIAVGTSVALGCWYGDWYDYCDPYAYCYPGYGWGYYGSWSFWWGWGCYPYSWWAHPFSSCFWLGWGYWPYGISYWYPYAYSSYYSPPVYYSTVIYETVEPAAETVQVVEEAAEPEYVGEGVARTTDQAQLDKLLRSGPDSAARASGQYLTLGDRAFRDGRYADAVHFYARAVEFAPDEAVLYLVLSDGLFATGDYHYGAFALRKALELDPTLVSSGIDKHDFYADPRAFDTQLAQLEGYLADRPGDNDARLMLAANYLFGGRPASAVDLLGDVASDRLLDDSAAVLILQAARDAQYGVPSGR